MPAGNFLFQGCGTCMFTAPSPMHPGTKKSSIRFMSQMGITGIRDMGGDEKLLKERRAAIRDGRLLGPHMFIAGPFLAAGKADAQTIPVPNPEEARRAVDSVKADGFDFVKILSNVPRESYFAI